MALHVLKVIDEDKLGARWNLNLHFSNGETAWKAQQELRSAGFTVEVQPTIKLHHSSESALKEAQRLLRG